MDAARAYHGPDAYRELANSKLDAVVIETPTYYHAMQAAAAVEAGKHVYCAKPIAVDVPSSKDFLATGRKAQDRNLSFWVDFQSRARPVFQEAVDTHPARRHRQARLRPGLLLCRAAPGRTRSSPIWTRGCAA